MLDLLDDQGNLTLLGSSRLVFDYTPEWARFIAKALEYGAVEGAIRIAAVLCREEDIYSSQVRDAFCHPDGDVMTVLQIVWMAKGILKERNVTEIHRLAKNKRAEQALEKAGLQPRGVMQVIQNIESNLWW